MWLFEISNSQGLGQGHTESDSPTVSKGQINAREFTPYAVGHLCSRLLWWMAKHGLCSFFKASAGYRTDVEGYGVVAGSCKPDLLILGGGIKFRKWKYFPNSFCVQGTHKVHTFLSALLSSWLLTCDYFQKLLFVCFWVIDI